MLGKMITNYTSTLKELSSPKYQKLSVSERLKLAAGKTTEAFTSPFKGEEVHLSSAVTNIEPPPLQEETFLDTPPEIKEKPFVEKQLELPFSNKTTGEKFELKQTKDGPALAMLPDDSPKIEEAKVPGEEKIEAGKGNRVIDGEIYVNGKVMDPDTGEFGDKKFWTYKDKTVTGKKLEHIDGKVFVDAKEWDPETGTFTGKGYWPMGDKKIIGKEASYLDGQMVIDGKAYEPDGTLIGDFKPDKPVKENKLSPFMEGVEFAADGVNAGIVGVGGALAGAIGMAETAAALGLGLAGGPVGIAAMLLIAAGAGGGFLVGSKVGEKLSKGAGRIGAWISKKLGKSEDTGRVLGKAALGLGVTAPIAVGAEGIAFAGGMMALGGGAMKVADKISEKQEEKDRERS